MASITKYPSSVSADGWANPNGFLAEANGPATAEGSATPDAVVSGFGFSIPSAVSKLTLGVKVGAVPSGGALPALDRIQPTIDGVPVGDLLGHGMGVQQSPGWLELELYPSDLTAAGLTLAVINSPSFGVVVSLYDSTGAEQGNANWSAGPIRATAEY